MIDTIKAILSGRLKPMPSGWTKQKCTKRITSEDGRQVVLTVYMFKHVETKLRIKYSNGAFQFIECELPSMIHPHNGYLIKTQKELDLAVKRLLEIVSEICDFDLNQSFRACEKSLAHVDFARRLSIRREAAI